MASLATGSVNFPNMIYENPPELIDSLAASMIEYGIKPECEIFDLAMLYAAAEMVKDDRLKAPAHVQFVFGLKNALPPKREILEFEVAQPQEVLPGETWTAAGIARSHPTLKHKAHAPDS